MSRGVAASLFDPDDLERFGPVADMTVTRISKRDAEQACQRWHYTQTGGSHMWSFGLWDGFTLVGAVTYNMPTRHTCESVFGPEYWDQVLHMSRLVCAESSPRNSESRLIGGSLKLLPGCWPQTRAVVTYAAQDQGHVGYVYQATNALYCGTGGSSHNYLDRDGLPVGTYLNEAGVTAGRAERLGLVRVDAKPKHRYLYLLGSKTRRKESLRLLRWTPQPYPKATP